MTAALEPAAPTTPTRRFLGWRMVWVAFFVDFIAVGFFFYSYGVFFKSIAAEFGDSRFGVAIGISLTNVVGALLAPIIGRALDRYPLKRVQTTGAIAMGVGFLLLGFVDNAVQFYIVLGLFIGFGAGAMGQLATSKLVASWFVRKRGTALGIAATGISVSGVVMPSLSAWLIEQFSWREGFMIYGVITLALVVPLVLRLVISRPEDVGLRPDGAMSDAPLPPPIPPEPLSRYLRNRNFWALVATIGLLFGCQGATLVHMVPLLTDRGFSLISASAVMSMTAALGIGGKLICGWLVDRWPVRNALWLGIAFQVAGLVIMMQMQNYYAFMAGAALFGFGMGGVVPMQGAIVGAAFGRDAFGRVLGAMRPPMAMIQILGVPYAGWIFDATGSYEIAQYTFLGCYALAVVTVGMLRVDTTHA
ncbi:MAG: MFS transporter [Pseudomonadota bacterium]